MKQFKIFTLILFFSALNFFNAQKIKVEFIIKNDSLPKKEKNNFTYLHSQTDISTAKYIGRIKATSKFNEISLIFPYISDLAKKKGANSFKFIDFKNANGVSELLLDTYVIDENIKLINENLLPKNKIFFFGKDNIGNTTSEEFKLNGETKNLNSLHYYVVEFNNKTTIGKGSFLGSNLTLNPKNNDSVYINFSGFGASPTYMAGGGMGVSFSGGKVIIMDKDTGLLLTHIFAKQE